LSREGKGSQAQAKEREGEGDGLTSVLEAAASDSEPLSFLPRIYGRLLRRRAPGEKQIERA